jgi:imidazolonepropionase-like amidohydrolase
MITLYPAQILGVADRLGSIEPGKDASFIVTDGNPLDIRTQVLRAFIQGREIDLSTRHTDLNAKYGERLNQIGLRP